MTYHLNSGRHQEKKVLIYMAIVYKDLVQKTLDDLIKEMGFPKHKTDLGRNNMRTKSLLLNQVLTT